MSSAFSDGDNLNIPKGSDDLGGFRDVVKNSQDDPPPLSVKPNTEKDSTKANNSLSAEQSLVSSNETLPGSNTQIHLSLAESVIAGKSSRTDFPLIRSKVALLVIDIQEYLSKPSTPQQEHEYLHKIAIPRTIVNVRKLLSLVRKERDMQRQGCEVIFTFLEARTKDCRDVSLDYKLSGPRLSSLPNSATAPAAFLSEVMPLVKNGKGDILMPKTSCSAFISTNLHYVLQNLHIEQLIVAGQLTDECVLSAVRDAADLGYFVTVVDDACAAMTESSHQMGLLCMKGFCRILNTSQVMEELTTSQPLGPPSAFQSEIPEKQSKIVKVEGKGELKTSPSTIYFSIVPVTTFVLPSKPADSVIHSILTALRFAGVKFLRFMAVDAYNSIRCKVIPLDQCDTDSTVAIAKVCFAGLPTFADHVVPGTGLDAKGVLTVVPDYGTLRILPYANKSAVVFGTAHEVPSHQLSTICTRGLLTRVLESAKTKHDIIFNVGAELEFHLISNVTGRPVDNCLFASTTTLNQRASFITDCYEQLRLQAIDIEQLHAESGPGQLELVIKYQTNPLLLADQVMLARETIKAVAQQHDCIATFLPKTFIDKAGNGLHLHLSFGHANTPNAFPDPSSQHNGISSEGQSFIEGILKHLKGLVALTLGSNNSFRRVGPGCWTGHQVTWGIEDKEVPMRVCMDVKTGTLTNVEFKLSDSTSNLYLSLACILSCGLEGILTQATLRDSLSDSSQGSIESLPDSFYAALSCLEQDSLLTDHIMGMDLSQAYLAVRRAEVEHTSSETLAQEVKDDLMK